MHASLCEMVSRWHGAFYLEYRMSKPAQRGSVSYFVQCGLPAKLLPSAKSSFIQYLSKIGDLQTIRRWLKQYASASIRSRFSLKHYGMYKVSNKEVHALCSEGLSSQLANSSSAMSCLTSFPAPATVEWYALQTDNLNRGQARLKLTGGSSETS